MKDAAHMPDASHREDAADGFFEPGRNCWRIEQADRVGLIVDGADYFAALREALIAARRQVLLIGWDFDFEIDMLPGQSDEDGLAPDGYPNQLGRFIEEVSHRTPDLRMYLLKWNGAVLAAPGRILPSLEVKLFSHDAIHFALDGHHPFGACHHQKIVVIDEDFAFCGGIDVTENRWDTSEHLPDDPRRVLHDGAPAPAWHDATTALQGPVARALADLSRRRWHRATGEKIEPPEAVGEGSEARDAAGDPVWPESVEVALRDVPVAIARTYPPFDGEPLVDEIEHLYRDAIAAARDVIYLESQYFTTGSVIDAIEERLREEDGPEIVVVNPMAALDEVEDSAMHPLRGRVIERLRAADQAGRFRIWHPVDAEGGPIYVHAKILVVDDRLLRLGSSNIDDRSMGFDTECDIGIEATDRAEREAIRSFHLRLLGEHLEASADDVAAAWRARGSMTAAIDALNGREGRGLRKIEPTPETTFDRLLADTRAFDPRFHRGEQTSAGEGVRPRHLVIGGAIAAAVVGAWYLVTRRNR